MGEWRGCTAVLHGRISFGYQHVIVDADEKTAVLRYHEWFQRFAADSTRSAAFAATASDEHAKRTGPRDALGLLATHARLHTQFNACQDDFRVPKAEGSSACAMAFAAIH